MVPSLSVLAAVNVQVAPVHELVKLGVGAALVPPPPPMKPTYSSLFGEPLPGLLTTPADALEVSALATCAGVAEGLAARYSAAEPVTCGVAMDVPDSVCVAVLLVYQVDSVFTPGAKMSTQVPVLAQLGLVSVESVALTVSAAGVADGEKLHASWAMPSPLPTPLPAATAYTTPELIEFVTAFSMVVSRPVLVPRLMFATAGLTACALTQSTPATMPDDDPEPLQSSTRTATRATPLATP